MPRHTDPMQELLELQARINRLLEEKLSRDRLDEPAILHGSWVPAADAFETPEAYVLELELPGLGRDDIVVQTQGDELIVRGERRPAVGGRPEAFHRLERRHGPFLRAFRFPDEVDPDRITAEFTDGLLRLTVPKVKPPATTRVVRVERARGQ